MAFKSDQRFLAYLRTSNLDQLEQELIKYQSEYYPRWKRVAVRCAISRHRPCTTSWIQGLEEISDDISNMQPLKQKLFVESLKRISSGVD